MSANEQTSNGAILTSAELRRAWGCFATGVTIVTVRDGSDSRGMTANSFTSVSLDPPLVLVSIDQRNRTCALLKEGERFAVSVLTEAHRALSDRFAGRQGHDMQDHFEDVPHYLTVDGLPLITDALATFTCRVVAVHAAGDHSLFIGQVEEFASAPGAAPLLFFSGRYARLEQTGVLHEGEIR